MKRIHFSFLDMDRFLTIMKKLVASTKNTKIKSLKFMDFRFKSLKCPLLVLAVQRNLCDKVRSKIIVKRKLILFFFEKYFLVSMISNKQKISNQIKWPLAHLPLKI